MNTTDVYVMIPVSFDNGLSLEFENLKSKKVDIYDGFIKKMEEKTKAGMDKIISESLERYNLGSFTFDYREDDDYDNVERKKTKVTETKCNIVVLYQAETGLGIFEVIIPDLKRSFDNLTMIGDMVSTKHFRLYKDGKLFFDGGEFKTLEDITVCGKTRILYTSKKEKKLSSKDYRAFRYLLAGETSKSLQGHYDLSDCVMKDISDVDIAQYNYYNLYARERALILLSKYHENKFEENYKNICVAIYKCEIAILQNSAISRINNKIVNEIRGQGNIDIKNILCMKTEYGKTILLWDNEIYNYYLAQNISDKIVEAFGTKRLLEEYKRNSKYLDEVSNLQSVINQKEGGFLLNIVATILTASELIQLIMRIIEYYKTGDIGVFKNVSVGVLIVLYVWYLSKKHREFEQGRKTGYINF